MGEKDVLAMCLHGAATVSGGAACLSLETRSGVQEQRQTSLDLNANKDNFNFLFN